MIFLLCALIHFWMNAPVSRLKKLAATLVVLASFVGFAFFDPNTFLGQPRAWGAFQIILAIVVAGWTKLSVINISNSAAL